LKRPPLDYYKMLYADTAIGGEEAPTRCGHAFFGTAKCLFATDAPFDPERGRALIGDTIKGVRALGLPPNEMDAIFAGNARALLRL
jgi:aminocarboxymuconate-semialdehyde decarboxylase